jgi:hypothetical protein
MLKKQWLRGRKIGRLCDAIYYIFKDNKGKKQSPIACQRGKGLTIMERSAIRLLVSLIVSLNLMPDTMAATPYPGYIFCASGQYGYLISPTGTTVHTWKASGSACSNAYLLPDGSALFPLQTTCTVRGDGAFPHGRLQKISWDGVITWDAVVCDATYTPGYDLDPMPNGNVIVGGATNTGGLKIVEVQPSGTSGSTIVWSYTLPDSLTTGTSMGGGYINSLSYNPDLDYILIDLNVVRKLVVINHKGVGGIVYTYPVGTSGFTHAAEWVHKNYLGTNIPVPGADTMAMRLNNLLVVHNATEAVEVNFKTNTKVKSITYPYEQHEGSVQRLPNGNTLVQKGMGSKVITELDDNGQTVRTVTAPGSVARAYMYGPSYPGLKTYTSLKENTCVQPSGPAAFIYNAAAGTGKIAITNSAGSPLRLRIYSLSGKTVYSASTRGGKFVIPAGTFTAGVYNIEMRYDSGSFRASFVKM